MSQTLTSVVNLAVAVALSASVLLVVAGIGHVRHSTSLRRTLAAQGVVPHAWQRLTARVLGVAELTVGGVTLLALPTQGSDAAVALAAQGIVLTALGAYALIVYVRNRNAPCGCFRGDEPISVLGLVRTAVLASGTGLAALIVYVWPEHVAMLIAMPAAIVGAAIARIMPAIIGPSTAVRR